MSATHHTTFDSFATAVSPRDVGEETVIDFDIAANTDYEIQSCAMLNDDGEVVEAVVRFGNVEEVEEIGVGRPILASAWGNMVRDVIGETPDNGGSVEYEADLSDFANHAVPHLRVRRENIEEYGFDAMSVQEFADAINTLSELVQDVLRADADTMDATIDEWL